MPGPELVENRQGWLCGLDVPDYDARPMIDRVDASQEQLFAVRSKRDTVHMTCSRGEVCDEFCRGRVPELDLAVDPGIIAADCGQHPAVGRERQIHYGEAMASHRGPWSAGI